MKASRALLQLFFITACGAAHDAAPSASGHDAKPHTDSAAAATPANTPSTSGNSVRQPAMQDLGDTAHPILITGRTRHDSIAYASAVAFGRRMMAKWPTPPTPLPGSMFPAKRVVAFYGNPLSKRMGVLGE